MTFSLDEYSSKSISNKGTLEHFLNDAFENGFNVIRNANTKSIIEIEETDRIKIILTNDNGKKLTLYISRQLDSKLSCGEKVNLLDCLVYSVDRGSFSELVIGVNSSLDVVETSGLSDVELNSLLMSYYINKKRV